MEVITVVNGKFKFYTGDDSQEAELKKFIKGKFSQVKKSEVIHRVSSEIRTESILSEWRENFLSGVK